MTDRSDCVPFAVHRIVRLDLGLHGLDAGGFDHHHHFEANGFSVHPAVREQENARDDEQWSHPLVQEVSPARPCSNRRFALHAIRTHPPHPDCHHGATDLLHLTELRSVCH